MTERRVRYDGLAKGLHWLVALLFVASIPTGMMFDGLTRGSADFAFWLDVHETVGTGLLALAVWRLGRRLAAGFPPEHPAHKRYEQVAARWVQYGLLAASVGLPLSGIYDAWVAGDAMTLFGTDLWPMVNAPRGGTSLAFLLHGGPLIVLLISPLVLLHAAAAVKHQWIDRDDTLRTMLPGG